MRPRSAFVSATPLRVAAARCVALHRGGASGAPHARRSRSCGVRVARGALPLPPVALSAPAVAAAVSAIAKLLTTLAIGVVAARRGVLQSSTISALSKLVYNLFLPSLLFSNVLRTLSAPFSNQLLLLPLVAFLQVLSAFLISALLAALLRLSDTERPLFHLCSSFGNAAALPLLLATSLFSDALRPSVVSAISFFLLGWSPLFWSLGFAVLSAAPTVSPSGDSVPPPRMTPSLFLDTLLTPPLIASFSALLLAFIHPLRDLFLRTPLLPALQTLGSGYSAAAVLILAGSLARNTATDKSSSTALRMPRLALGIILCRFIALPLLVFNILLRVAITDRFVRFAILLQSVMPSAQNVTLMLTLMKRPHDAAVAARLLLFVYVLGVIPIALALSVFLAAAPF
ncbi:Protein PIN-LIKES 5 [Gracilariopsis chorda]|uniref:Protein PIN-LIKES 5 n=1 Tax=Gracilariopsis chorda TaxID=448386 RepID=A0A2V3J329_9FLOR|nr:Protein PIN-LIKES 5 [Gracilariopsis chorda]|eukprot:PXF48397.1 Protein PIN-LIKES 5 [Gracilariopsis chorda]